VIGKHGATPVSFAPLDPLMRGLVGHVSAYEELAIQAALHGSRDRVVAAMLAHPLIGQYDQADKLADLLLAENASYLPWAGGAAAGTAAGGR
jgi:6-phospho-beta-glucosidase